ncbi:MAG: tripartite tricarboxylate transporter substrate binding protein [Betaproteobacteria bacterium]|jgi:tripartite-type tricarboxylate transporter receptor subunit TctC
MRLKIIILALGLLQLTHTNQILADTQTSSYPNKPIKLIVGPGTDVLARMLGEKLTQAWGQAVIIDPRPAAGGIVAGDAVAKAPPDGYTLLLSSSSYTANDVLQPKMPYDISLDLRPVSLLATIPIILVVNPDLPVNNLKDLVNLAKSKPGQLNYASAGNGTAPHLAAEMFKQQAHVEITHVPYKGTNPAITDVMSGQVQIMFATAPAVLPMIQGKKLKAIAITGTKRYKGLPDLPTAGEQGFPGFSYVAWNGIHVPAKTPSTIVNQLSSKISEIMNTEDAKEKAERAGFAPNSLSASEFEKFQEQDLARLKIIIRDGQIKPE